MRHRKPTTKVKEPTADFDSEEYEVERVAGHWYDPQTTTLKYIFKWKGYSKIHNTWEPDSSLFCEKLVHEYWERYDQHQQQQQQQQLEQT